MMLGIGLLFGASVYFGPAAAGHPRQLPVSAPRALNISRVEGGDSVGLELPASKPRVPIKKDSSIFLGSLTAASALVVDDETNTVLFEKNSNRPRALASLTKLMTALILNSLPINWQATTTVTSDDVDSSSHHLTAGDVLTLDDLWHAALIGSSNSAVEALVRESGVSNANFVDRMNARARELRLPSLAFTEPTGLSGGDVGSAWDAARLLKEALKIPRIERALMISEYYIRPAGAVKARRIWSTDWLLNNWIESEFGPDQIAGKTGFIAESGYNFAARFTGRAGKSVRVVILGADTNEARFSAARDLASWALKEYVWPSDPSYSAIVE